MSTRSSTSSPPPDALGRSATGRSGPSTSTGPCGSAPESSGRRLCRAMTTSGVSVSGVDLRELRAGLLAGGLGGRAFTEAYAEAVDEWLRTLFARALDGRDDNGVVLLAVGGLGPPGAGPGGGLHPRPPPQPGGA